MTWQQIQDGLRRVRHKVARNVLLLGVAERRIRHHKRRKAYFHERVKATTSERKAEFERKRRRAHTYLRRWQKRQTWLAGKHRYLQTVLHRRLRRKARWLEEHKDPAEPPSGLVNFDGKQVAAWIAQILQRARATGLWGGYVISGWRSAEYSESLCYAICGAPSCAGTCAGRNTNHTGIESPGGAVDVSDPYGLEAALRKLGETRLQNDLPADRPHFSSSGH